LNANANPTPFIILNGRCEYKAEIGSATATIGCLSLVPQGALAGDTTGCSRQARSAARDSWQVGRLGGAQPARMRKKTGVAAARAACQTHASFGTLAGWPRRARDTRPSDQGLSRRLRKATGPWSPCSISGPRGFSGPPSAAVVGPFTSTF